MEVFEILINRLTKADIKVYLSGIRTKVDAKFINVGFIDRFPEKRIYSKVEDALKYIEKKHGDKINTDILYEYTPDKKKDPELEKEVRKQIGDK